MIANTRDTIPNGHRCQARAIIEGSTANTRHTIRDSHRCQARATIEGSVANTRDTIPNGHRCQARVMIEGIIANARHAIAHNDFCNAFLISNPRMGSHASRTQNVKSIAVTSGAKIRYCITAAHPTLIIRKLREYAIFHVGSILPANTHRASVGGRCRGSELLPRSP